MTLQRLNFDRSIIVTVWLTWLIKIR